MIPPPTHLSLHPLPQAFFNALTHPDVTDICVNGSSGIFIDQGHGMEWIDAPVTNEAIRSWILEQLSQVGKTWDAKMPFVDALLLTGHRVHVAFPPVAAQGVLISLRRLPTPFTASSTPRWGGSPEFQTLSQAVQKGDSILISGATGSGKTTLASDLLSLVHENERIIALEDTQELAPRHRHFLSLISRTANADGFGEAR